MSNRLSFAQILQQKKNISPSTSNSRVSTKLMQSQITQNHNPLPDLAQLMEDFIQYPNQPDHNFILSFNSRGQKETFQNSQHDSMDFSMGVNPLDSWILSQSNLNGRKSSKKPNNYEIKAKTTKQISMNELSRRFVLSKENSNLNIENEGSIYKFSSRTYQEEKMENSQFINEKNYQKKVLYKEKDILENAKIIQSQTLQSMAIQESKREVNNKKEERGVQQDLRNQIRKQSRYQVNNQETDRKQQQTEPTKEKKVLILSKGGNNKNMGQNKAQSSLLRVKPIKKQLQQQQMLMSTDLNVSQKPIIDNDKLIQDTRKQISQYLQIQREKSEKTLFFDDRMTPARLDEKEEKASLNIKNVGKAYGKQKNPNYSFSNEQFEPIKPPSYFENTNTRREKGAKSIEDQERQNELMLACIEYTRSEADVDIEQPDEQKITKIERQRKVQIQISESTPEIHHNAVDKPMNTFQKYFLFKSGAGENRTQNNQSLSSLPQESVLAQKVMKQQSIEQNQKNEVNNSDIQIQNSIERSPEIIQQSQQQEITQDKLIIMKPSDPSFQVNSVSIRNSSFAGPSDTGNEMAEGRVREPELDIPRLNNSNFESMSNDLNITEKKESIIQNLSCIDSTYSNDNTINSQLRAYENNYGFVYKMRVSPRNNSFLSNYDSGIHGSEHMNKLYIPESLSQKKRNIESGLDNSNSSSVVELYNMNKFTDGISGRAEESIKENSEDREDSVGFKKKYSNNTQSKEIQEKQQSKLQKSYSQTDCLFRANKRGDTENQRLKQSLKMCLNNSEQEDSKSLSQNSNNKIIGMFSMEKKSSIISNDEGKQGLSAEIPEVIEGNNMGKVQENEQEKQQARYMISESQSPEKVPKGIELGLSFQGQQAKSIAKNTHEEILISKQCVGTQIDKLENLGQSVILFQRTTQQIQQKKQMHDAVYKKEQKLDTFAIPIPDQKQEINQVLQKRVQVLQQSLKLQLQSRLGGTTQKLQSQNQTKVIDPFVNEKPDLIKNDEMSYMKKQEDKMEKEQGSSEIKCMMDEVSSKLKTAQMSISQSIQSCKEEEFQFDLDF